MLCVSYFSPTFLAIAPVTKYSWMVSRESGASTCSLSPGRFSMRLFGFPPQPSLVRLSQRGGLFPLFFISLHYEMLRVPLLHPILFYAFPSVNLRLRPNRGTCGFFTHGVLDLHLFIVFFCGFAPLFGRSSAVMKGRDGLAVLHCSMFFFFFLPAPHMITFFDALSTGPQVYFGKASPCVC